MILPMLLSALISQSAFAVVMAPEEPCETKQLTVPKLADDIEAVLQRQNCEELPVGGSRISVQKAGFPLFGLSGHYSLKRLSNKAYAARISVAFVDAPDRAGSGAEMLARSRACLAQANQFLKGPDGETLEIQLLTHDETNSLPSEEQPRDIRITLDKPGEGTHSYNFPVGLNCPAILHEFLHHLGLCDENEPSSSGNGFNGNSYQCRPVPRNVTSVMGAYNGAWNAFFEPRDPRDPPRRRQSLLYPNQFYKILEMDCPGRSAAYQACGMFAYRGENCSELPAFCRDSSVYLGPQINR